MLYARGPAGPPRPRGNPGSDLHEEHTAQPRATGGGNKDQDGRLLWHCGHHTVCQAESGLRGQRPRGRFLITRICSFLWHMAAPGGIREFFFLKKRKGGVSVPSVA